MEPNEFQLLKEEAAQHGRRAKKATYLEAKKELSEQLYPFLEDLIEKIDQRMRETEDMVSELIESTESVIQPELRDEIVGTLEIGLQLCTAVEGLELDEINKKRLGEIASAYKAACELALKSIEEVTLEEEPVKEHDKDKDDEEDDEDETEEPTKAEEE